MLPIEGVGCALLPFPDKESPMPRMCHVVRSPFQCPIVQNRKYYRKRKVKSCEVSVSHPVPIVLKVPVLMISRDSHRLFLTTGPREACDVMSG